MNAPAFTYYVTARRGTFANGQTVYLCTATHDRRMVPNAPDLAARFEHRDAARMAIARAQLAFKGLTDWQITREPVTPAPRVASDGLPDDTDEPSARALSYRSADGSDDLPAPDRAEDLA
jgi:hypothetical protein